METIEAIPIKTKIDYFYDYGASTYLEIKIHQQYQLKTNVNIELLSRNEVLKILYDICDKEPAV